MRYQCCLGFDRFRFFVVKFELLQIFSAKATVVLGPDDRGRGMRKQDQTAPPRVTESARRRREYWQEFLGALRLDDPGIKVPTANTLGNLWFNLRGHDLWITVYAASSLGGLASSWGEARVQRENLADAEANRGTDRGAGWVEWRR
jgi:hypothetical protein